MGLKTNLIRLHFVGWVKTRQRCRPIGQTKRAGNGGSSWPTGTLDPPYKLEMLIAFSRDKPQRCSVPDVPQFGPATACRGYGVADADVGPPRRGGALR